MAADEITKEQAEELDAAIARARVAQKVIENYSQEQVDRLCRAVAWAVANKKTFERLTWLFWVLYKLNRVPKSFYMKYTKPQKSPGT